MNLLYGVSGGVSYLIWNSMSQSCKGLRNQNIALSIQFEMYSWLLEYITHKACVSIHACMHARYIIYLSIVVIAITISDVPRHPIAGVMPFWHLWEHSSKWNETQGPTYLSCLRGWTMTTIELQLWPTNLWAIGHNSTFCPWAQFKVQSVWQGFWVFSIYYNRLQQILGPVYLWANICS